jgi:hypothetical protein
MLGFATVDLSTRDDSLTVWLTSLGWTSRRTWPLAIWMVSPSGETPQPTVNTLPLPPIRYLCHNGRGRHRRRGRCVLSSNMTTANREPISLL